MNLHFARVLGARSPATAIATIVVLECPNHSLPIDPKAIGRDLLAETSLDAMYHLVAFRRRVCHQSHVCLCVVGTSATRVSGLSLRGLNLICWNAAQISNKS